MSVTDVLNLPSIVSTLWMGKSRSIMILYHKKIYLISVRKRVHGFVRDKKKPSSPLGESRVCDTPMIKI